MKKLIATAFGALLLLAGLISMVTPIPGATFMLASGAVLLICASPRFHHCLQLLRGKFNRFDRFMTWLENKMPKSIGNILKMTAPSKTLKPTDTAV